MSAGQVVIVGVGLIGGSIGLAVRSHDPSARVVGVGRDRNSLDRAWRRGAIHEGTTDLAEAVSGASVVVVCTPVSRVAQDIRQVADVAGVDALVTDAGSTKRQIVEAAERHPRAADVYVGAHPMAGSERSGVDHARGDLFVDRVCVLTPTPRTPPDRLEAARRFWGGLGCRLVETSPAEHDEIVAYTSHLPHAAAAALAGSIPPDWLPLAAGAFRDGTRVAAADTNLWTAIFRANRGPMLKALGAFQGRIAAFEYALMTDDEDAIGRWWDEARARRLLYDERRPGADTPARPPRDE